MRYPVEWMDGLLYDVAVAVVLFDFTWAVVTGAGVGQLLAIAGLGGVGLVANLSGARQASRGGKGVDQDAGAQSGS